MTHPHWESDPQVRRAFSDAARRALDQAGRRTPVRPEREAIYRSALRGLREGWWPTYADGRPLHPFCSCGAARLLSGPVPVALYCTRCDRV